MIEFINSEKLGKTKPLATDILLTFKDEGVTNEQFTFLKERLDFYRMDINSEYVMKSHIDYDKSSETVLIGVTITIPDRLIPKNHAKLTKLIMDLERGFLKFYEEKANVQLNQLNHSKLQRTQ